MELKDRIEKLNPYFISFNVIAGEDASYVLLRFPDNKWTIPDQTALKENFKVEIAIRQEGVYFMTEISNGTECLFDAADYVITFNKNVEERKYLLNEKIKELTEIFATETLDNLKKLTFEFPDKVETPSKKAEKEKTPTIKKSVAKKTTIKQDVSLGSSDTHTEKKKDVTVSVKQENNDNDLMSLAKGLTGE